MRALCTGLVALAMIGTHTSPTHAQEGDLVAGLRVASLRSEPEEVTMTVGERVPLSVTALDGNGNVVNAQIRVIGQGIRYESGFVTANGGAGSSCSRLSYFLQTRAGSLQFFRFP